MGETIKIHEPKQLRLSFDDSHRRQLAKFFRDEHSFGTTLLALTLDWLGFESLDWDHQTIAYELRDEIGHFNLICYDKLIAARDIVTSDGFYEDWEIFNGLCLTLNGYPISDRPLEYAEPEDMAWAMTEAAALSPPDPKDDMPYSDDVRAFIGAILDEHGILQPPGMLEIAKRRRSNDELASAITDWSDEPDLMEATEYVQQTRNEAIDEEVRTKWQMLVTQLHSLKLKHGEDGAAKQLTRLLSAV
mgnify:CR=1 FL=1